MEKIAKQGPSNANMSGDGLVSSGNYFIVGAVIVEKSMAFAGLPNNYFDSLQIELAHDDGGKLGFKSLRNLQLNGVWREKIGADGKPYKAKGTFFELLFENCSGMSFSQTCAWINANLKGRHVNVNYCRYPRSSGGFGCLPVVEFI